MSKRFSHPSEALVDKNSFRGRDRLAHELSTFAEVRSRLPEPVLPQDTGWTRLYWAAWEWLWGRLRTPGAGSTLTGPYIHPGPGENLAMGRTSFLAQLAGYLPSQPVLISALENFYACQHDDGFIGRELDPTTGEAIHQPYEPNSTGPNLMTWAEWRYFRLTDDRSRIESVFWPLMAYHRWCRLNRSWPNGLYWATGYSSGLVNQPRVPGGRYHHKHWSWVDAGAQAYLDTTLLERMAILMGEQGLAEELGNERTALGKAINTFHWNEEQNYYQDLSPDGHFSSVKSIAAYWALQDQHLVPPDRLTPFVQHLRDTWSFKVDNVLPSLSADSDAYNALTGNGWRGAVWPDLTYMVVRGLLANNHSGLAHSLAARHIEMVCRVHESTGLFWENYAPEALSPGDPAAEDLSGLTAMATIGMILENIIGLSLDWPLRQVTWDHNLTRKGEFGVRNYPLGTDGTLDLIAAGDKLNIRSDVPLTLIIREGKEVSQTAIPAGSFELAFN